MTRWSLSIPEETNLAVRTFLARKGGKKGDLSRFVDEAVRRTPGFEAAEMQPLLEVADFVVIPVQPTPNDLRAVGPTVQTVKTVGRDNFCFVVTRGVAGAKLTIQTPLVLSQHGPVATTIVFNRVDYAGAMADGRTIQEIDPKGKGAEETSQLWVYVRGRMHEESPTVTEQERRANV